MNGLNVCIKVTICVYMCVLTLLARLRIAIVLINTFSDAL